MPRSDLASGNEKVVLLLFQAPARAHRGSMTRLSQKLYGRTVRSPRSAREYAYHGLLDGIPHRRLGRGAMVLFARDLPAVETLLRSYGMKLEVRVILPTVQDRRALGRSEEGDEGDRSGPRPPPALVRPDVGRTDARRGGRRRR